MRPVEFPTIYELQDVMKKVVLASLMTVAMGGAFAQVYVGGAVGRTNLDGDCSGTTACDNDGNGYKLYAGYKFTPNLAVEAGYADFGKATATVYSWTYGYLRPEIKSTAPFVVGVVRGNFTPSLAGVARLGLASVDTKVETTQVSTGIKQSDSKTEAQAMFGLALEYGFTKNFKGTVDLDFTKSSEVYGESGNIRMISLGAQYHF
jgi:OOP family OmpA-OmpF porin